MIKADAPVPTFPDIDGKPLENGYVYIGVVNQNPEINPITVYWDAELTQPAAQPLRTSGGMIFRNGSPASVYMSSAYSITVRNKNSTLIYTFPDSSTFDSSSSLSIQFANFVSQLADPSSTANGDALVAMKQPSTGAVSRTVHEKFADIVSVTDFGADPTGVADSTAAFNIATQATVAWSSALEYNIDVPPGHYKLNGTVYVRKGQTLRGSGHGVFINCSGNTTGPSFSLGNGFISGVSTADAGGSPVKIENMWTSGGAAARGVIYTNAAGFSIQNMFLTAPGIGLEINGADGLVSNIEIDQCLNGIVMGASQNIIFSNIQIYLPNYAVVFNSDCRDITFNGGVIEYPQYSGVLFRDAQANIKGITFSGVDFTMNTQYATFTGYVYKRASAVEAQFTGCSFRNMYNYAVQDAAGVGCNLTFTGCVFDGSRTTTEYAQSTTAKVINTGGSDAAGVYNFYDCEYRNLLGEIAAINDGVSRLSLIGGAVQGCDANAASQKRFNVNTNVYRQSITVKGVVGFPYKTNDATNQYIVLPYWGGCTQWEVSVKGNTFAVGSTTYSRAEKGIASVSTAYNGSAIVEYCDYTQSYKTPTRAIPGDIGLVAAFGTTPGGASSQAPATKGTICVSSPTTAANAQGFEFYAETST